MLGQLRRTLTLPRLLLGAGLFVSTLAVLDPARPFARLLGPALVFAALASEHFAGRRAKAMLLPLSLAVALAVAASGQPQYWRSDFQRYFSYLQSLGFDHDLDFRNEAERWGAAPLPETPTGKRSNDASIGAALLWSPFFLLAHVYVVAGNTLGFARYGADGFSAPYFGSALAGTLVWAVCGAWALGQVLAERLSASVASLAILAAVGASSIVFYVFVQPGMSHGLVFGLLGLMIWAADEADRNPSPRRWALLGVLGGLLVLVRPQAALACVFVVPLLWRGWSERRLKLWWLVAAAGAFVLVLGPQLLAWKSIYGQWLPAGAKLESWAEQLPRNRPGFARYSTWFDARSLHLWDVLFGADRGFFTWSPTMLLGVLALPLAIRRFGALAVGGLLVFLLTAWFNGALATPTAGDSFGARRFDVVVPFAAIGLAVWLDGCARRPLLAPALALGLLVAWNLGLVRLYGSSKISHAPLEQLAQLQVRQAGDLSEGALARWFGPGGRAFAYRFFVGEYFFWNGNRDGILELAEADASSLAGGWSGPMNGAGPPDFRMAFYPKSCVRFPLMIATALRVRVFAKAPGRLARQTMRVFLNGRAYAGQPLSPEWSESEALFPEGWAVPGRNLLCLEFDAKVPSRGGRRGLAAQVRQIEIGSQSPVTPTPVWGFYNAGR